MRPETPVGYVSCVGTWFVTRHGDVARVAEDVECFTAENGTSPAEISFGTPTVTTVDGPVHTWAGRWCRAGQRSPRCSGHAFARQQIRIAVEVLVGRFPGLAADPARPPVFRGWEFRAPTTLWVRV
jgi:cytochrome P450